MAAGMILAAGYVLPRSLEGGWVARGIAFAPIGTLMLTRVNPLLLLALRAGALVVRHGLAA